MGTNASPVPDGLTEEQLTEWVRLQAANILKVPPGELRPQARWVDDLEADSLDMSELAATVERTFEVRIDDADLAQTSTFQETCGLIWSCLNGDGDGVSERSSA